MTTWSIAFNGIKTHAPGCNNFSVYIYFSAIQSMFTDKVNVILMEDGNSKNIWNGEYTGYPI